MPVAKASKTLVRIFKYGWLSDTKVQSLRTNRSDLIAPRIGDSPGGNDPASRPNLIAIWHPWQLVSRWSNAMINNELILAARLLLATLFLIFGWRKLKDYPGTVRQIAQFGGPTPRLAAVIAILMELPVAFAVAVGAFARVAALLLVFYTLGTALIGHRYWTVTGAQRVDSMDGFYKNLSIIGGFLLLYVTGAGSYSIDALRSIR